MSDGVCNKKFHFDAWPNADKNKKFIPYPQRDVLASWEGNEHRNMSQEGVHLKTCQALEWKELIAPVKGKRGWYRLTKKGQGIAYEIQTNLKGTRHG